MFYGCAEFNCDLSEWNVSNGEDFTQMFYYCTKFNSDISTWKLKNDAYTDGMFFNCNIEDYYKPNGIE